MGKENGKETSTSKMKKQIENVTYKDTIETQNGKAKWKSKMKTQK